MAPKKPVQEKKQEKKDPKKDLKVEEEEAQDVAAVSIEPTQGYGQFEYINGACYTGNWQTFNNVKMRHGFGKFTHAQVMIPGSRQNTTQNEKGQTTRRASQSISGTLQNEHKQVEEEMSIKQEEYEGDWFQDVMHGYGTYKYLSGAIYTGEWNMGKHHGKGTYKFANGAEYVGNWENHKMHGVGKFTDTEGQIWEGIFIEGSFDSKIQSKLRAELEQKKKIQQIEKDSRVFFEQFLDKINSSDKKTMKENMQVFFVVQVEEAEQMISGPYARFEDRNAEKWKDLITQFTDPKIVALQNKDQSQIFEQGRILADQLQGPGQIVEYFVNVEEKQFQLALLFTEDQRWICVYVGEKHL